ncbi:MAG TPA: hypothetical protein VGE27_14070 [Gemmatimonas sp.]
MLTAIRTCGVRAGSPFRRTLTKAGAAIGIAAVLASATAPALGAQAFNYPAMQTPRASERDYTAAVAAGSGTSVYFQWREGVGNGTMHWQLDAGLADPKGRIDPLLFLGGGIGKELVRATDDQPLDVLLTAGAGAAFGNGTFFRIPVGASIGHTFPLEEGMAITPFVHPRASIVYCSTCQPSVIPNGRGRSKSTASLHIDLGADWRVNPQFALRLAASFGGSDILGSDDTVGVGLNWTPAALRR